jgi:hypothetical protein
MSLKSMAVMAFPVAKNILAASASDVDFRLELTRDFH